ncbi:LPXTG cell wall anchor domain-containing protein, partial [Candidatus Saccharibacteria bacterium]|nr:LPXTG cell wall anchor domain-containing protein [Candidatus Saccharibacteria bacterium]
RGATRPQGNAYDSGAYESPYTRPATDTTDTESLAETGSNILGMLLVGFTLLVSLSLVTRRHAHFMG